MTHAEKCKQWRKDNPDYAARHLAEKRKQYAEDPVHRKMVLRRAALARHKLTIEQYDAQLKAQNKRCALCGKPPQKNNLHVDHDHKCCDKKFTCGKCNRGLLCSHCNIKIGYLEAFLAEAQVYSLIPVANTWLHRAVEYLKKWRVNYTETRDDGYEMHNRKCSYGLGDIGGPGCICTRKPETRT